MNLKDNGEVDKALPWLEKAYSATTKFPQLIPLAGPQLLDGYALAGKSEKASSLSKRMLDSMRPQMEPGSRELAVLLAKNGLILLKAESHRDATLLLDECAKINEVHSANSWQLFHVKAMQGEALLGVGKAAEAEALLLAGVQGMQDRESKIPKSGKAYLPAAQKQLIRCYEELGKQEQSDALRELVEWQ